MQKVEGSSPFSRFNVLGVRARGAVGRCFGASSSHDGRKLALGDDREGLSRAEDALVASAWVAENVLHEDLPGGLAAVRPNRQRDAGRRRPSAGAATAEQPHIAG